MNIPWTPRFQRSPLESLTPRSECCHSAPASAPSRGSALGEAPSPTLPLQEDCVKQQESLQNRTNCRIAQVKGNYLQMGNRWKPKLQGWTDLKETRHGFAWQGLHTRSLKWPVDLALIKFAQSARAESSITAHSCWKMLLAKYWILILSIQSH